MPSSTAGSAVASLRVASRRLWHAAAVSGGAALGLLPLLFVLHVAGWQRVVLGSLCLLYIACKGYRLRTAWQAVRQLRLEGCFIGQSFDGYQLRHCLQRRSHLWMHSYTVRALRRLMARPLPNLLLTDKKRERVRQEYRHTLSPIRPLRFSLGLPIGLGLVGGGFALTLGAMDTLATWPLRLGLASGLLLLAAEGAQTVFRYRARRGFEQLVDALADWTLAHSVHKLLRGRQPASYRHTPLYRAPAWFSAQAPARPAAANGDASAQTRALQASD